MANAPLTPLENVLSDEQKSLGIPDFKFSEPERAPTTAKAGTAPTDLMPLFEGAAQKYNVPVNILLGLADQESRFNTRALGQPTKWGRAKGLMQYLDSTAQGMGINPYDPAQSIDAAAKQLAERLGKGYSMIDAVREHFAGPDRKQWGKKTEAYGNEVMQRAAKFEGVPLVGANGQTVQSPAGDMPSPTDMMPGASADRAMQPGQLDEAGKRKLAQDMLTEMNASEPGRYSLATPEQIAAAQNKLPGTGEQAQERDGFWSATGKALSNIPGNFKEAAGGMLRYFGEGVDDNTLYFNAQKLGVLKKLQEDGVITMGPNKHGLATVQVPYLPNGDMADISNTAKFLRDNAPKLFSKEQMEVMNGIKPNAVAQTGIDMAAEARKDRAEINPDGPLAKYGSMIISSTAEMAPALIAGAVTRNPNLTLGMIGGQVYGQSYEKGREKGLNPDEAGTYAAAQAAAEAIPSALPVHAILAPSANFFKGLFKAGLAESVQEGITGALQAGIDKGTIDPNMTWEQAREQIVDSMIVGAGAGVALRGGTEGVRRGREAMRSPEARLGEAMEAEVDNAQPSTTADAEARAALDPNTQPAQQQAEAAPVDAAPVPQAQPTQPAPSGPLGRALERAPVAEPPVLTDVVSPGVDIPVLTDVVQPGVEIPVLTDVVEPDAKPATPAADEFMGPTGSTINVAPPGVEPFQATIEGYADGEVLLRDQEGNRFQVSQAELQPAEQMPQAAEEATPAAIEEAQQVQPEQVAEVTPAEQKPASVEQEQPARREPKTYDQMDEPELRERLKYLARQAKQTGWDKKLVTERKKVEAAIEAKKSEAETEFRDKGVEAEASREDNEDALGRLKKLVDDGTITKDQADAIVDRSMIAARKQRDRAVAGDYVGEAVDRLTGQQDRYSDNVASTIEMAETGKRVSIREAGPLDIQSLTKPSEPAKLEAADEPATTDQPQSEAPKWFGTQEKADAYIAKKKLAGTHEVKLNGRRYEVVPKAQADQAVSPEPAPARPVDRVQPDPKANGHINRARKIMNANVGDFVRPSADIGYSTAGHEYFINTIDKKGTVHVTNQQTGSSTTWERSELERAARNGVSFGREVRAEAQASAAPSVAETQTSAPQGKQDAIVGADIDGDWASFAPASGTLNVPRAEMPQIKAEHRGAMVNFLNARGVAHEEQTVPADSLKPTQAEFSREKVKQAQGFEGGDRSILVSSDDHVLDGHHQWMAKREAGEPVKVIRLDAPIRELLPAVAEFPSATQDQGQANSEARIGDAAAWKDEAQEALQRVPDSNPLKRKWAANVKNGLKSESDRAGVLSAIKEAAAEKPTVSANKIFTEDAAEKARALLRSKLTQLNSGIDPEIMQAGITLAGYHIEKGARTFTAYAKAMTADLGDIVRPYLKSWYMGVKYDPRATGFEGMSTAAEVEAFDLAQPIEETRNEPAELDQPSQGALERAPAEAVQGAEGQEPAGERSARSSGTNARRDERAGSVRDDDARGLGDDSGAVPVPASREQPGRRAAGERQPVQRGDGGDTARGRAGGPDGTDPSSVTASNGVGSGDRGTNYTITEADAIGTGGAKTKYKANVEAIQLLKKLEASGRPATAAEQAVLAKYVGWGGIPQAFERSDNSASKGWEREVAELRELLTPEEYSAAASSTKNAHYTRPEIVAAVWRAADRLGFKGGRVLEPSVGAGNFFGLMPHELRKSSALHGVELDRITSGIATQLYPEAKIARMGFQDYTIPDGHFDIAIGNPPFGRESLYDGKRKDISGFSIHNYFFAKSLDGLKEGGILAMVVTNRMMDVPGDKARSYMDYRADFIGAIRLPNDAFMANAGTAVTTDIIFMRKRGPGSPNAGENWMKVRDYTDSDGKTVPLNEYFHEHPENMLGDFGAYGSMYREGEPALIARDGQDTAKLLDQAIARLPLAEGTVEPVVKPETTATVRADNVRVGSMFVDGDTVKVRGDDVLGENTAEAVTFPSEKARDRVMGMIGMRDQLATLRGLQLNPNATEKQIATARLALNKAYDAFVKENGPINLDANKRLFRDDPSWPQLSALEDGFDKGISAAVAKKTGEEPRKPSAQKAAIFTKRTQSPYQPPESASSAKDALVSSLAETGRVDLELMGRLYGKSEDAIVKELGDLVFQDPTKGYVTRDEYLSGNVKAKLAQARQAAQKDVAFARNVEALEAVQPRDIEAVDINVKPGAAWLPTATMAGFANHIGEGSKARAIYNPATAKWSIMDLDASRSADARWSTGRVELKAILEAAANQKTLQVFDNHSDGSRTLNETETQLANDKVNAVKEEWGRWVWADDARREQLAGIYNTVFNTNVAREYDGSHLTFPGKVGNDIIALRPHQANGVWRIVQSDTTLADHVVGAGKTFTLIAGAMELRRMGLAKKPMFAVPNHLVGQWAADFTKLYPGANVLAATKKDFDKENRKRLFARIATGDWDAVIVAHSSFGKVEVEPKEQAAFIEEQIADLDSSIELMRQTDGEKSRNVKDVQKRRDALREKLKKLLDADNKDDNLYWGELGIDALFVDEAHEFKNLAFSTSMNRVAGLGNQQGSQKASDMFLKVRQVLNATGGRNVVFATGTPISNTMAEMFTMQRYLDYSNLKAQGISHFDAWARMFGEVVTDWELSPSGKYKMNSRFSKFVNMPELMQRYTHFADVINRDDINRMLAAQGKKLPVPKLAGGKPTNVVVPRSPDQARYIGEPIKDEAGNDTDDYPQGSLVWRSENMPKKAEKGADNMLKIMGDARKAALDMRLIDPSYPDYPNSKVNHAAGRIKAIYDEWHADRGTQLVFIDLSTPKNARAAEAARLRDLVERAEQGDEQAIADLDKVSPDEMMALDGDFSVYDDLKQKLIDRGIPEAEIAFIHDAKTELQKDELFGKVRSGRVRVLFGSTAKMGAGMNVQDRLVALHHLDAPWRPSDLEQREGRIIRQGNKLYERDPEGFEVRINRYATKQTLDSRMWQTIEGKANFIEQVRKGTAGSREIEDVAGEAANAAEMKAAASGNPLILEEMSLRQKVRKLETERQGFDREQHRLRDSIRWAKNRVDRANVLLGELRQDAKRAQPSEFEMTIDGQVFDKRKDAGEALLAQLAEMEANETETATLGKFGDFTLQVERIGAERFMATLEGAGTYEAKIEIGNDPMGAVMRITNSVKDLGAAIEQVERDKARAETDIPKLEAQAGQWSKSQELAGARSRHAEVLEQLKPKKTVQTAPAEAAGNKASLGDSASLGETLRTSDLGGILGHLIDGGHVVLHDTAPDGMHPQTQGWTGTDGKINLVADRLTPESAKAVLLHEAFHSGGQALVKTERWQNLMARLNGFYKAAEEGRTTGEWAEAFRRVQKAQEAGDSMSRIRAIEELGAYAIENYERAPNGVKKWVDGVVGAVKDWLYRRFGIQAGAVTPAQLRSLAVNALRDSQARAEAAGSIGDVIARIREVIASAKGTGHAQAQAVIGAVPRWVSDAAAKVGLQVSGFSHIIDGSAVRHILNRHGNPKLEATRGQIALTEADIERIPQILENPDAMILGTKTNLGRDQIGYLKRLDDGSTLYLEEVRTGRRRLAAVSMRKYPAARNDGDIAATLISNARSDGGTQPIIVRNPASDKGSEDIRYSVNDDAPTAREVDSWFSRALTDAMAGAKSKGQFSLLATAPMDRMIEELAGDNMHATEYLKLKRDMDAYRAKKHAEFDTTAQKWLKLNVTDRQGAKEMARIMHDATIAQADPAEGFKSIVNKLDEKMMRDSPDGEAGKAAFEKKVRDDKRRTDHAELSKRFKALSPQLQAHYREVRDTYQRMTEELDQILMDNLAAAIDIHGRKAERTYEKELAEIKDEGLTGEAKKQAEGAALYKYNTAMTKLRWNKKARLTMMRQQFEANRLEGPYFPLARFGDYFVTVRDRDTGEVISFSRFESRKEQQRFAADAKRVGKVQTGLLSADAELRGSVDPRFVSDVEDILGGADVPDSVKDQVWQRYLESMPDMSMRKGFIHRKNREGYTQDALRAFASRMFHGAHQLGRLKYGARMQEAIDMAKEVAGKSKSPERDMAVANEINRRHDYVMNPKGGPLAQKLTSAAFIYHLSMSPAAALVNLSQTAIIGIPVIGAKFGTAKTIAQLSKAVTHFVTGKGHAANSKSLNDDERSAMRQAYEAGIIDSSQAHNLAGVGETGVEYSAVRNKVMGVIAWQFHQAERLNREVTFLAAYRLARADGMTHAQAVDEGARLTYKTHFDYSNTNRPRVMHGDVAKVALVFRNYQVNMLWRLFRDTHQVLHGDKAARTEAVHQLAGVTGMMALSAGVKGVWLYGVAMIIASMIFGDDAEEQFKKGTVDLLGPTAAGMLLNGIPGHLTGTSLSGRIGMPDLWFRSPDRQLEGKDEFNYWQSQLLGALPGIAQNLWTGWGQIGDGKVYRGVETMSPKFVKDIMRTARFAEEGATTLRGDPLVSEFKGAELLAQMLGFTPAVLAEQYERNSALKNAEKRIMDRRRGLMDKYAAAYKLKDDEAKAEAMGQIKEFNGEHKEVAITPQTIRRSLQSRQKYSDRTEGGVNINPKLNRSLRDSIGPAIYR